MLDRPTAWRMFVLLGLAACCLAPTAFAADRPEPTGTWRWERELQDRTLKLSLRLQRKDGKLTGVYRGLGEETAIQNVKLDGDKLLFQVEREINDQKFTLEFQGKIEGDKLTGAVSVGERELPWEAVRSLGAEDVVGTWQFKITTDNGQTRTPSLKITSKNDALAGLYTSEIGDREAQEIKLDGMELSFKIAGERDGTKYSVVYKGRPKGDSIKGTIEYEFGDRTGSIAFEGQRKPNQKEKKEANE